MRWNSRIYFSIGVTVGCLVFGMIGYAVIEKYSLLDAFYMAVITIFTVGYGEIHTLSNSGRLFTIFLILMGFGSLAFLAHAFTEAIIARYSGIHPRRRGMLRTISKLEDHHIICGFGRVGEAAAEQFGKYGEKFVVIESEEGRIKKINERGYDYIPGDATQEDCLLEAGIKKANSLLALLNGDPDNLFAVLTARELNPTLHIIARTEVASSEARLLKAGADSIISLYASAGRRVAERVF